MPAARFRTRPRKVKSIVEGLWVSSFADSGTEMEEIDAKIAQTGSYTCTVSYADHHNNIPSLSMHYMILNLIFFLVLEVSPFYTYTFGLFTRTDPVLV